MTIPDPFGAYQPTGPRYAGMQQTSIHISMRDGTRLAADVTLPKGLPRGERLPTVLIQTRYWRAIDLRAPFRLLSQLAGAGLSGRLSGAAFYTAFGYAVVSVDVRGTGASFGVWRHPWEAITVQDAFDLVEWIVKQPWSNGRVGGVGVSYLGTCAELLLATGHPAVRGVVAQFNHPDSFTDIGFPGGLLNERFVRAWGELDEALDQNHYPDTFGRLVRMATKGVQPVDGPQGRILLAQALAEHAANAQISRVQGDITFRDQPVPPLGFSSDDQAVARFMNSIQCGETPVFGIASWVDAGTGAAALRRFNTFPGMQRAMIGAWNHGGLHQSSPYLPARAPFSPPGDGVRLEMLRFLDACLKAPEPGDGLERGVMTYTLGRETWQTSPTWPPRGTKYLRWFLGERRGLQMKAPANPGSDEYTVDFRHTTGAFNRWWELGVVESQRVDTTGRETQREHVLAYETAPLDEELEIAGAPVVNFTVTANVPDCAFYVYLEDVLPDGRIILLTEGQLRAIHRRISVSPSPYRLDVPHHNFRQDSALPFGPGEPAEITFGLLPVSVVVGRGHRLRLAFAGHDADTFPRIPAQGQVNWCIEWGGWVDVPAC